MPLILDKITLPRGISHNPRPRLLSLFDESLACCTSTILTGRAGTGKTVLAAQAARQCARRVAWYKVDAPDADPATFFHYLLTAIGIDRAAFDEIGLAALREPDVASSAILAADRLIYELLDRTDEPILVVVDDLHLIYDAPWVAPFFRRLLPLLPAEAHFVLTGRSLPPAPLWRMRSKQTLRVVDEAALAFTLPEAVSLFAHFGLTADQAREALAETRGRAALLDLRARSLSFEKAANEHHRSSGGFGDPLPGFA